MGATTWTGVSTIDTGASASDTTVNVYVLSPSDMWFISGSIGLVQSGSIGHSIDGGKNWTSLTSAVSTALGVLVHWLAHQGAIALPLLSTLQIDGSALAWTALAAVVAAVLFGLLPGLRIAGGSLKR